MRYTQIRAFHHVALTGGFSRAAEAIGLTQPAISDQVRRLEEAHDVLLFHRDARSVRLTEAGEGLFQLTKQFFEVEDAIAGHLDQSRAAKHGTLRVVADSAAHITSAIGRFRVSHPRVFVSLRIGNTEEVLAALRRFDAEVGVVGNLSGAEDLDQVRLGASPVIAIAARGFVPGGKPLALTELADWPLIFRETGSKTRRCIEAAARAAGLSLTPNIEVEGREAMREVVASGAGLGFVSEAEFGHDDRLVRVSVAGLDTEMTETLVTLKARADVPVIRAFLSAVRA